MGTKNLICHSPSQVSSKFGPEVVPVKKRKYVKFQAVTMFCCKTMAV